ncbi:hypothetical protein HMPREF9530_01911 [Escherichia coli MS 21-1]|nr:predicted protein [Escherichia coli FVEC1412]EFI20449.1 predicted protein [Escherichia coli FVEC1302]EFJ75026.1 hypothetical protein HMPREF9552_01305 [Escherichia coli MS 198-1]EFK21461.1 hypothetical protein HMPREF9530_01911 [Escherichia coli MS 21-1]ESD06731.1 hypothetical protein HMPREF1595_02851 [Escherichia coli 907672]
MVSTDKPEGKGIFSGVLLVFLKEFTFLNFQDTQTTLAIVRSYTQIKDRV